MSFRTKLTLGIALLVTLTGAALTISAYISSRRNTAVLADALFREVTAHAATAARDHVSRVVPVARSLAVLGDRGLTLNNSNRLAEELVRVLRANPGVTWISYGNEEGAFTGAYRTPAGKMRINMSHIKPDGHTGMIEYEVGDDAKWTASRHEEDTGYDPRKRDFYKRAKEAGKLVWMPPYIFYEQSVPGITCATPMFDASGKMLGVLTFDFDLNTLSVFAANVSISPNARVMLLTPEGVLLAHPTQRIRARPGQRDAGALMTVADTDDPAAVAFFKKLAPADAVDDRYRLFEFESGGVGYYAGAHWFRVDDGPVWVVGALAPKSDFMASVDRRNLVLLLISVVALVGAVLLAAALARRVSGPVVKLAHAMSRIGAGDLETSADLETTSTEFRQLSAALDQMTGDLREGLRVRTAMQVARQVQQELMPAAAPATPGLDIAAHSSYCDETGGDYYDYLPCGECGGTLIAVGDVAGHGIGAALFMATARGIVRSRAYAGGSPAEIVTHLNQLLVTDMQSGRFMTMCLAAIDPVACTIRWVRAGHDPVMIYDPVADEFHELDATGGLPLGIDPAATYEDHTQNGLCAGQVIVLGTDGIWEMPNPAREVFGKERLRKAIRAAGGKSAAEISLSIQRALANFRDGAKQRDDVTFVVVKVIKR